MGILQPQVIVLGNTAVHTGPGNYITLLASVQGNACRMISWGSESLIISLSPGSVRHFSQCSWTSPKGLGRSRSVFQM